MAHYTRKTFDDAWGRHPLDPAGEPSGLLKFMRRRREVNWRNIFVSPAWNVQWGVLSAPMEIGRAAVQTARFFERLGQTKQEFAGPLVDTRMAYTMRQAALHAMHNSAYSLRGAIQGEAKMLHS